MEVREIKSTKRIKHYSKFCEICKQKLNKKLICNNCNIKWVIPMNEHQAQILRDRAKWRDMAKGKNITLICKKCGTDITKEDCDCIKEDNKNN